MKKTGKRKHLLLKKHIY